MIETFDLDLDAIATFETTIPDFSATIGIDSRYYFPHAINPNWAYYFVRYSI